MINCKIPAVLCAALVVFSGCASTLNAEQEIETIVKEIERTPLTLLCGEDTAPRFEDAAKQYMRLHEDVAVKIVATKAGEGAKALRERILGGDAPDLVYLPAEEDDGVYAALARDEALYDLSALFEGSAAPALYEGFLNGSAARAYGDSRITGAPLHYESAGLFFKVKTFEEQEAAPPETLAAFTELGEGLKEQKLFGFPADYPAYLEPFVLPLLSQVGGRVRNATGEYEADVFSAEAMQTAVGALEKLAPSVYAAAPDSENKKTGLDALYTAFGADEVLCITGDATMPELLRKTYGIDDKLLFLPMPGANGQQYLLTRVTPAYIPAAAAQPALAVDFLRILYSEEQVCAFYSDSGFALPVRGAAETAQGMDKVVATLFESGVVPFTGTFAEDPQTDAALFQGFYEGLSGVLSGTLTAKDWGTSMDELLAKRGETPEDASSSAAETSSSSSKS